MAPNLHLVAGMSTDNKEESAKREAAKSPDRDDVHEQREKDQSTEGLVEKPVAPKKG